LALFDDFMQRLHVGKILNGMTSELYAYNAMDDMDKQEYLGVWLLVDNGYLAYATTVSWIKSTSSKSEIQFYACFETFRKDVECTFSKL
jgi:hypothetical protein